MPIEKFEPKLQRPSFVEPQPPAKEPPKELPPPPTEPTEYFPGYQQQYKTFQEQAAGAQKKLENVQKEYSGYLQPSFKATNWLTRFLFGSTQTNYNEAAVKEAKAQLDIATQEYSRVTWRLTVLTALPYMMADESTPTKSVDDIFAAMPNDFLNDEDRQWLQASFDKLSYLIPKELPEAYQGDKTLARADLLDSILSEPKLTMKAVHNLTVDELMKSIQPISAEIPAGMTAADVRDLLTQLNFDPATQDEINSIHNAAEELKKDWVEQSGYINLLRDGTLNAEIPPLTTGQFFKLALVQPAMATMELLDKYYNMLPRPVAAWAITHFPRINPDSDAAVLEDLFNKYHTNGTGAWEAYSKAFQDWGENTWLKMFVETIFDPTTYIGLGIATKIAKPIPYIGKFVGAIEKGWLEMWDLPFKGARNLIKAIPKTPMQRAISYARQAFMDSRAFLRRFTGKDLEGLTVPEIREAFEFAVKQASERPMETGDLAVKVGRYLTEHDLIEESAVKDWIRVAGGEGAQITQQMVHDVNYQFDAFFRKTYTARESAANMLTSMGVETTEKSVAKMATLLDREGSKILSTALDVVKGDSARDALGGILRNVEDMQIRRYMSPVYQYALKSGRITFWVGRKIDAITRNSILTKIDRMVVAPMANQYLLFTNYGPFNVIENSIRSFLGGGELLYPMASSPVDELVRWGEGLTSLPYEAVMAQRELGRLEIAVIDPKTNKTLVFNKGKIPGVTKELPFGVSITIGGKKYPLRSWQNLNNVFGDIGSKQRYSYLLTKGKQFLAELAPDQIQQIATIFEGHQSVLDGIKSFSKSEKNDIMRVLQQDATVGPDMVRKHDIPLSDLERRKALREINKTLDKCTDIYSPHKQLIRDKVLDGSIWKDVPGTIDAIKQSVREFNIVSLQNEGQALDKLVADLKDFAPATSDELLRNLGFISDIVDGVSERIGEVRSITQSRAAALKGAEADDFHKAASETLGNFLGKSSDAVNTMLDSIKANISRPRTLLDDLTLNLKLGKSEVIGLTDVGFAKSSIILDGEDIGSIVYRRMNEGMAYADQVLLVDKLNITKSGVVDKKFMQDMETLIHNLAQETGATKVKIIPKDTHKLLYTGAGYTKTPTGFVKDTMKPKPGITLTADQTQRLSALTDAIKLRHSNTIAARDLDRKIINDAVSTTPRNKRTTEWWNWLEQKRSKEAWEPYWAKEEVLFNQVEDIKLGMMNSLGVDITVPKSIPQVVDKLTPAHVAYMMGVAGDDMYKALTKVGAMTTIRSKARFTTWVYRRANKAAATLGKTAEEIGFDRAAIGDVYDQMFAAVGIDPAFANKEVLAPAMMQLDDVSQELTRQYGLKAIPADDYSKFKSYINGVADDLDGLPMNKDFAEAPEIETRKDITALYHTVKDIERVASGKGTIKLYHGAPTEFAESLVKNGPKVPYKVADVVDEVAKKYGLDPRELSARAYRKHEVVESLSTATAPVASRWAQYFPQGEILSEINDTARILLRAKETRQTGEALSKAYERVLQEGGTATKAAGVPASHTNMAKALNLPDRYAQQSGTGALVELEVDISKLPEKNAHDAETYLKELQAGNITEKQALEEWNHSYKDFRLNPDAIKSSKIVVRNIPNGPQVGGKQAWTDIREQAMAKARTQYEMDFTDYENRNMVDAAMRMIYPFWTYEWQRWFWVPRAMLRAPGVGTAIGRYMDYTDNGYIPIPGTDIQFNPLRGTVFMGGFRRLMMKDYPEYYDKFPGMKMIDFISRIGFYPGVQIMLPIVAFGAATGNPQWSEILPSWATSVLDAARAVAPQQAGAVIDHLFPNRFKDYLTMLTLGEEGYDADAIWRKKTSGAKLTEEEQKLWLGAENKATGLKGLLFEQTGIFRLRPQEYQQFIDDNKKLIEAMTGVPVKVQDEISNNFAVTGKRFSDYFKLDALQQKIIYNSEAYKRWQGVTTPLEPAGLQQEDIKIKDYYETVAQMYTDYRKNGVYDEQGSLVAESLNTITQQWIAGTIGPDQWRSARGDLLTQASAAIREMGSRVYPDVPKTLDERAKRFAERGMPAPTYSPDQELMYMYYDIKPEMSYNWETGVNEYDYDAYYAKIDALIGSLDGEYRQRFLDRIQYDWNGMEKLYWQISSSFLRPYRLVRNLVLEQYTPEEQANIKRFEVARGDERIALQELIGSDGQKLISGFASKIREARLRLRYIDPELDAWCYFFGITDTWVTNQGEAKYKELAKQYMTPTMSQ